MKTKTKESEVMLKKFAHNYPALAQAGLALTLATTLLPMAFYCHSEKFTANESSPNYNTINVDF